eukprot:768604-Hanusia_phi.AAC.6
MRRFGGGRREGVRGGEQGEVQSEEETSEYLRELQQFVPIYLVHNRKFPVNIDSSTQTSSELVKKSCNVVTGPRSDAEGVALS